jgi:APA family basic amino acid/polyamine antiporter
VAVGTVVFLTVMNILATKLGGAIQNITTVGKLIPIFVIAIFGIFFGHENIFQTISVDAAHVSFGAAVLSTLWAYDGWILVGNVAGEMEDSKKNLPRAILTGLTIVIIGYLGVNLAIFHTMNVSEILALKEQTPVKVAEYLLGGWSGKLVSIGILVSIFGCLNGTILSSPRIPYAMASRGDIRNCDWLTWVHPKFNTPYIAIIMQALVGIAMILLASPDQITDFAIFSVYIFYTMAFIGLFLLRKKTPVFDGYKTPFFPFIPAIAIVSSIYILGSTVLHQPKLALISVVITGVGLPIYLLVRKPKV